MRREPSGRSAAERASTGDRSPRDRLERPAPLAAGAVDVGEWADCVLVRVDLPGVAEADVEVTVDRDEDVLEVRADPGRAGVRSDESESTRGPMAGGVSRSVRLPRPVDAGGRVTDLELGVLTIILPIRPDAAG